MGYPGAYPREKILGHVLLPLGEASFIWEKGLKEKNSGNQPQHSISDKIGGRHGRMDERRHETDGPQNQKTTQHAQKYASATRLLYWKRTEVGRDWLSIEEFAEIWKMNLGSYLQQAEEFMSKEIVQRGFFNDSTVSVK